MRDWEKIFTNEWICRIYSLNKSILIKMPSHIMWRQYKIRLCVKGGVGTNKSS